jgi:hypothetical protein
MHGDRAAPNGVSDLRPGQGRSVQVAGRAITQPDDRAGPQRVAAPQQFGSEAVPGVTAPPLAGSATLLALQRAVGNRATTTFIQAQVQRPKRSHGFAATRRIQRYSEKELQTATLSLNLPSAKVQGILETGEATGLFREVYEVATSKFLLNPEGFAKMLGAFRATMPKKGQAQIPLATEPSTEPAVTPGGIPGFVRELLYGLAHIRKGLYVQYGAMAPDDLADALDRVGLKTEAAGVRKESHAVALGAELGGDVAVWGRRPQSGMLGETVQHKVVEGKDDFAVANELRNAIHQLAGSGKELALESTQRIADIVIMPANTMATAEPGKLFELIKGRMKDQFRGKSLSTYVDVVRITASAYEIEYEAKAGTERVVPFSAEASDLPAQQELSAKTPGKWDAEAISRPLTVQAEPDTRVAPVDSVAPDKKIKDMNPAEIARLIDQTERKPGKQFHLMSKSELEKVRRELAEAKAEWLATKTATEAQRNEELGAVRESWVTEQVQLTQPKEQSALTPWRKKLPELRATLKAQWDEQNPIYAKEIAANQVSIDQIENTIQTTVGEDAGLLQKFNTTIAPYAKQIDLFPLYEQAAKERKQWVTDRLQGKTDKESIERLQQEWALLNVTKVPLVEKNLEYAKINEESIKRDKELKKQREDKRKEDEAQVTQICNPLLVAVSAVLKKPAPKDLMDSLIAVLQQARHAAAIGALSVQLAEQLAWADKLALTDALERTGLGKFTQNLCKHRDYNNLQGDLSEITDAVRMAQLPAEERAGPVVIGSTTLEPDKSQAQPQEVDVSFESKGKSVLHLHEVAWDLKTLEKKLLGTDKQSQREGYARVIKAQRESATGREVRMTYVVHKTGPDDQQAIGSNVAPSGDELGSDVSGDVTAREAGAMAKILSKRGYYLSLGGTVYTPQQIAGWITQ